MEEDGGQRTNHRCPVQSLLVFQLRTCTRKNRRIRRVASRFVCTTSHTKGALVIRCLSLAARKLFKTLVPRTGVEPARPYGITDSKPVAPVLTPLYYALPSSTYRRRQSKQRLAWYRHVTPSSSLMVAYGKTPHLRLILNQYEGRTWRRSFLEITRL